MSQLDLNSNPAAAAAAKSLQSCPTLCNPIDSRPPGSTIPGILQARTLEWVTISFSNAWKWKMKVKLLSRVRLLATPWTTAYQATPSMGFSRQEYWSGFPFPSPQDGAKSTKCYQRVGEGARKGWENVRHDSSFSPSAERLLGEHQSARCFRRLLS